LPLQDIAIPKIVRYILQYMGGRRKTLYCAIEWAMKGGSGVPKQSGVCKE